jgi:tetratricopeptide (TPR) repeat protein
MNWLQTEFLLKGVYLGLLVAVALQKPTPPEALQVGAFMLGGLVLCLGVAGWKKVREGYRIRGRLAGFIGFLLLDNPVLVYAGIVLGLTAGAYSIFKRGTDDWLTVAPIAGGAFLGLVFWYMRRVPDRQTRLWLGLALAVVLVGGAIAALQYQPEFLRGSHDSAGYLLLLGIPGFWLLTFAGLAEESEIEIAAVCAALGVGLWVIGESASDSLSPNFKTIVLVLPIALYFLYTRRIMPGIRVFKHVLRGISYAKVGRFRPALISLRRALELNPADQRAQEALWRIHQEMDFTQLVNDPETLAVVDFQLCLDRVSWLLLQNKPRPEQIQEAHRLMGLVESQRPALAPRCRYWRAVAYTHQGNFDEATAALESVLAAPEQDTSARRTVLFPAWQLAIMLHPELKRRVGSPMLAMPGRRMEAIAAVERQLAVKADDSAAWDLKRLLYSELTESDYDSAAAPGKAAGDFDHEYVHQLGLALIEDRERWQRGCEYLRMAARGLPLKAPAFFIQMGKAHERAGDPAGMWRQYDRAMQAGRAADPRNLSEEERQALFAVVKQLGDHARTAGDIDKALEYYKFHSQSERAGIETWRTLAELFEQRATQSHVPEGRQADMWMALHCTEHALTYDAKDKDLLGRKDRYYYSITPVEVRERLESIHKWFDPDYCREKARWVLEKGNKEDLDLLNWAGHLAELAQAYDSTSLSARVLRARVDRFRGETERTLALLEEVRNNKPEKFATSEEEEAWFLAHRLLGELYVDDKPDQAVLCLQEFRKSAKSGANTLFNLGRAYENLGDTNKATRCYEQVVAFEGNPLVYDARDALDRLRGAGSSSFS